MRISSRADRSALARLLFLSFGLVCAGSISPAQAQDSWGAVAAGIDADNGFVGTGVSSQYDSEGEAVERAMAQCRTVTPFDCELVFTFSVGCAYISTGRNEESLGWGTGADAGSAYNSCQSQGLDCGHAAGACN
jgi:hypothetical protein